jgi:hypothetical protein
LTLLLLLLLFASLSNQMELPAKDTTLLDSTNTTRQAMPCMNTTTIIYSTVIKPQSFHLTMLLFVGICIGFVAGTFCTNYYHKTVRPRQQHYSSIPEIETTLQYPRIWWDQHHPR